ncbi:hypothetical protein PSACC_01888 [Paramicrosporidium saccamoebae]|uniref:Uncharacterized protein n=1 Tax=Paramicrosporidium saccamoebae TaxID=1246581 RepID=A0A2H9TKM1_9FUNG|nr:hypothetical protein PSACC_01888 [Paramicrosporidium saccamoebae]
MSTHCSQPSRASPYQTSAYCLGYNGICRVDSKNPLSEMPMSIRDQGAVLQMSMSPDGVLATVSILGHVKLWYHQDNQWSLLGTLRDGEEPAIEEFYCGVWLEDYYAAAGKRKDRHAWNDEEDDNQMLPGVVKVFNPDGSVLHRLEGHEEEILFLKKVSYAGQNILLSCSQDGYIFCWTFSPDWTVLLNHTRLIDDISCMVFSVEPLPGTGDRLLLAACDDKLRIFDMESMRLVQSFDTAFTSFCDHAVIVDPQYLDPVLYPRTEGDWFVLARGVELLNNDTLQPMAENSIRLFRLSLVGSTFKLQQCRVFADPQYQANSWLLRLAVSGSLVAAPTVTGSVVLLNLNRKPDLTVGWLCHHDQLEVRQVLFHQDSLFSCADDGMDLKLYKYFLVTNATDDYIFD